MQTSTLVFLLLIFGLVAYYLGQRKALHARLSGSAPLHSLPVYYGSWTAIWAIIPAGILLLLWSMLDGVVIRSMVMSELPEEFAGFSPAEKDLLFNEVANVCAGFSAGHVREGVSLLAKRMEVLIGWSERIKLCIALILGSLCGILAWHRIQPELRARNRVENVVKFFLLSCASLAILTTIGIVLSVLFEALRFFDTVSIIDFIFGTHWSPQISIREDQVGSSGAFGAVPLFAGTLLISGIAMLLAVPVGLMSAIYLSEYASKRIRAIAKPALEILAGIPTVVYGFFAALTVAPMFRNFGEVIGLSVSSESALAAGLVMGIMIIPFVSSLSDDVINAVPQSLRDGALGLGSTRSEMITQVVLPAALPGIVGSILLAVSRAIGETMIVVMAAGLSANLTINPLEAVTTVTVQIVTLLVGDQEFDSPKTLAAFALGLMLFLTTLALNFIALYVVRKYREQYD